MGIRTAQLYFKDGLPDKKVIHKIFNEITGLELHITEQRRYEENNLGFCVEGFYQMDIIDYYYEGKCFYLEAPIGSRYFFFALLETFYQLGAKRVNNQYNKDRNMEELPNLDINNYLLPSTENKYWKNLKKWNEYNESERPAR